MFISCRVLCFHSPYHYPRNLLDSRQNRVSLPVKFAPSTSCVPPVMTAMTVRKEDRGNDDHFYTWWWYWRWCLPALQGAVQLRLRVTRPKLHYWILSNSQIGTFQFSRRWRWQQWWRKQICFQPRLQLQLPFTPKAALSGFPQTSEPWNVDNKIFPTAWVRKDFEVSSKLSKFIVGSLSDPSPSPHF